MTPPPAAAAPLAPARRAPTARARPQGRPGHRAPLSAPRLPRRVSGPARGRASSAPRPGTPPGIALAREPLAALGRLIPGALVDREDAAIPLRSLQRLLAGRLGIALVAFALIGIVTLQLGLLKLNGGIGRALEHEAALQRENAALSIENSELAAGDRVELSAARIGMQYVAPGTLQALVAHPASDATRAAAALREGAVTAASPAGAANPAAGEAASSAGAEAAGPQASAASSSGEAAPGSPAGETAAGGKPAASGEAGAGSEPAAPEQPSGGEQPAGTAPASEAASAGGTAAGARAAG